MADAVVITGASSGIGEACARLLDGKGYRVFAGVRRDKDGAALRKGASERMTPLRIDVTNAESLRGAAERLEEELGEAGLAGLVNNAGIAVMGPLEVLPLEDLRRQLEVNVVGVVASTQALLPLLRKGKGRIVNVGSLSGMMAAPFLGAYSASKFALEAITDAFRMELSPWGIGVCIVEPANTSTPIWDKPDAVGKVVKGVPKARRALYEKQMESMGEAMRRMSREGAAPEKVARVVADALAAGSPKARYFVGTDQRVATSVMKMLPDWVQDSLVLRVLGQNKP
ncbi:MAG: SDR family oxidoreductase [FCB group bacterium]|jgi:NAD(P)-dependent dehydrogenase (short-subunit alcohol dehydrogenase family)|nr:SDR family oxidoreductase [FCB group bacterium]